MDFSLMEQRPILNKYAVSVSLPLDILKMVDVERGDINRSKYMLRLIQKGLAKK